MPGRFPILGAFIIVNEGRLLDAGMIEHVKGQPYLYRLPIEGVGNIREHLGLLFLLFYLYGESKSVVQARSEEENYLIYPSDCEDQVLNSQHFPGLVRYIKRYFPQKQERKAKFSTQTTSLFVENFGQCEIFDGKVFNKLFRVRRLKYQDFGIIQTGVIEPNEMLIFDVELKDLSELYEALQAFDKVSLEHFCVEKKKAEELVNVLQTAIKVRSISGNIIDQKNFGITGGSRSISKFDKETSPLAIHNRIQALIDEILQINDLLIPDGWNEKVESLKNAAKHKVFASIPLGKYSEQKSLQITTLLFKSLQNLANDSPEAELLLIIYYLYSSDYNMAVAESSKYCQKYENDGTGWFLKGKSLLFIKQNEQARKSFEKSLRLGHQIAARLGIALTYKLPADKEIAWNWISQAYEMDPDNISVLALKAKWLNKWGNSHEALELINNVLDKLPNWLVARDIKASCLYGLNRYDEVIDEVNIIVAESQRPFNWAGYAMAASLYCKGEYAAAKEQAQKSLSITKDDQEKGYLHIVLRKVAVQEKNAQDAVRHSTAMCRLMPERQTSGLWLAADLEWAGHSGLARGFWDLDIDFAKLNQDEVADALLLYSLFEKWANAVNCAFLLKSADKICNIIKKLSSLKLADLIFRIHILFLRNVIEKDFKDWDEPYQVIKRWHEAMPDHEGLKLIHLNQVAQLARRVDEKSFPAWCNEWKNVNFNGTSVLFRGTLIWRLYTCWSRGTKFPEIVGVIWPCGIKTIDELFSTSSDDEDIQLFVVCSLMSAMVGFGHEPNLKSNIKQLSSKLLHIEPDINEGICKGSLPYLVLQLLKYGALDSTKELYSPVLHLFERSKDHGNQKELAITASFICLAISATDKGNYCNYESINNLEKAIFEKLERHCIDSFGTAMVNYQNAKFMWLCNQHEHTSFALRTQIDEAMNYFQDNFIDKEKREYCICNYLGSIATIATNSCYDDIAEEMLQKLGRLCGTSDKLARYLAFYKRKVLEFKEDRPVKFAKVIKVEEEIFAEEKYELVDQLMVDIAPPSYLKEDAEKYSKLLRDVLGFYRSLPK
jgi:hypothetical protein